MQPYTFLPAGTHLRIFPSAPLLGPALGPIIGGVLTEAFNWRATFWFIAAFSGLCLLSFLFFSETFRRERSLTYQTVLKRRLRELAQQEASHASGRSSFSHQTVVSADKERTKEDEIEKESPGGAPPTVKQTELSQRDLEAQKKGNFDIGTSESPHDLKEIRLSFTDINPIGPILIVLSRWNNVTILFSSGRSSIYIPLPALLS